MPFLLMVSSQDDGGKEEVCDEGGRKYEESQDQFSIMILKETNVDMQMFCGENHEEDDTVRGGRGRTGGQEESGSGLLSSDLLWSLRRERGGESIAPSLL